MGNWKAWLHGLIAAAVSSFSNGVALVVVAPDSFNFTKAGLIKLLQVSAVSSIIAIAAYLKQSPLPPEAQPPAAN